MNNNIMKLTKKEKEQMYRALVIFKKLDPENLMNAEELRLLESAIEKTKIQLYGF